MPFNLEAFLGLNISNFAAGLFQGKQLAKEFGHELDHQVGHNLDHLKGAFAAAFGVTAVEQGIHRAIEYGAKIGDLSARFDVSTDKLQEWGFAAEQTGASLEEVASAVKKTSVNQGKALLKDDPFGSVSKSFSALGVSFEDLKSKSSEQIFEQIAERVREVGHDSQTTAALIGIMGKSADSLIPMFEEGLPKLATQFRDLGLVIDKEMIGHLKQLEDTFKIAGSAAIKFFAGLGVGATQGLKQLVDAVAVVPYLLIQSKVQSMKGNKTESESYAAEARLKFDPDYEDSTKNAERLEKILEKKHQDKNSREAEARDAERKSHEETKEHFQERVRLEEKLGALRYAAMSDGEKLVAIEKRKAQATRDLQIKGLDENDRTKAKIQWEEAEKDRRDVMKSIRDPYKVDSLVRIGGLSQGNATQGTSQSVQERQLSVQEKQLEKLDDLVRAAENGTGL